MKAPESILAAARRVAKRDGISLNQFINTALAEKVAALEAEEVFTNRAARADRLDFSRCSTGLARNRRSQGTSWTTPAELLQAMNEETRQHQLRRNSAVDSEHDVIEVIRRARSTPGSSRHTANMQPLLHTEHHWQTSVFGQIEHQSQVL